MRTLLPVCSLLLFSLCSIAQVAPYKVVVSTPASEGYYFVSPLRSPKAQHTQMILDSAGGLVYYKRYPGINTFDFKLQPNGMITYATNDQFYIMDSTFTILDSVTCQNGIGTDFHELQILPDGHYLMLGEAYTSMDLSGYPYFKNNGTPGSTNASVLYLVIQELDENKNVVFEWHSKDYFSFDSVDDFWLNDSANVDWTHSNALELDYDGNILISSRHFNEITKVNRTDSSVMWRMGGKYNQFTFIGDTVPFYGQHDIRRQANGNITLFDNGRNRVSHGARALEYQLDEVNKIAELKWSYVYDSSMFSWATGNMQRLPNNNTLINYGVFSSVRNVNLNVVDPSGNTVFELLFDDTLFNYRAFNYPQLPWSFNRPQITCFDSSGTVYLDAGDGHASYIWSNGASAQIVPVSGIDTLSVFVPYGDGGFISSGQFIAGGPGNQCPFSVSRGKMAGQPQVLLYPNPVHSELTIANLQNSGQKYDVVVSEAGGRTVRIHSHESVSGRETITLNLSDLEAGIYFVGINGNSYKFIKLP